MRGTDVEMVQKSTYVGGHGLQCVDRGVVRLLALAVATAVQTDHAVPGVGQRFLPASADPVEAVVGGETVHKHNGRSVLRSMELVMKTDVVAFEVHGGSSYPSARE